MFGALDPQAEHEVRSPDYVMEVPQSGERVHSRDNMRVMQEAFSTPPEITLRWAPGAGQFWTVECVNDHGDKVWPVIAVWELDQDGRFLRDTQYYNQELGPPAWRGQRVELARLVARRVRGAHRFRLG